VCLFQQNLASAVVVDSRAWSHSADWRPRRDLPLEHLPSMLDQDPHTAPLDPPIPISFRATLFKLGEINPQNGTAVFDLGVYVAWTDMRVVPRLKELRCVFVCPPPDTGYRHGYSEG
jgi:hypothetical protein